VKNQLSRHVCTVEQGAEIEVTDRQRPILRMVPARAAAAQIRIVPAKSRFADLRKKRFDILEVLLRERPPDSRARR
jgi:antitoxin (DNA-binding transcriptional repressor) of toxin-antitoxin stability system